MQRVQILSYLCATLVYKRSCYDQTGEEPGIKKAEVIQGITLAGTAEILPFKKRGILMNLLWIKFYVFDIMYLKALIYERVQPVGLISLSCNWVILHNEID